MAGSDREETSDSYDLEVAPRELATAQETLQEGKKQRCWVEYFIMD